ncbi:MAG: glycosyltransferase family 2 protein [Bacteroidales bacterium]|nr:glycosyltransferase family 2 protein [Bacteroidales bacterium]
MRITVIIPIYNVARYVEECLLSVMRQCFQDLEVMVVDDCGTDESMPIVRSCLLSNGFVEQAATAVWVKADTPMTVTILRHERNRGLSAARNTGIAAATGDYLYFLDSDDVITPDCISTLVEQVALHPGVDMVQGGAYSDDLRKDNLVHAPSLFFHVPPFTQGKRACRRLMQNARMCAMVFNRLLRREWVMEHGLYFGEGLVHEDELWTFTAGKHISSIAYTSEETYFYRHNGLGITANADSEQSAESICAIAEHILTQLPITSFYYTELRYAFRLLWHVKAKRNPLQRLRHGRNPLVRTIYRHWGDKRLKKIMIVVPCMMALWPCAIAWKLTARH